MLGGETVGMNEYAAIGKYGMRLLIILKSRPIMHREKPVELRGILMNIIKQKAAEEALREEEERYRFLFEKSHDAIFIADLKTHRILDANREAERLMGRSREEIIGMHQSQLHPPEYEEYYTEKFREHVRKGSVFDLEAEIKRPEDCSCCHTDKCN